MKYYLYIITNYKNTVLYLGVTNNLKRRIKEHKDRTNDGFSSKYKCNKLIWFEEFEDIRLAIDMEKKMKKWKRKYKENLINEKNPKWNDLNELI
ncbi:MAG: GIY-YIG nuclease family protein [Bacteroidales bacterium]|jgi:putative endonuclease|nr:GIY-YIG nuclease family protein [Bacteroidales bacterium]